MSSANRAGAGEVVGFCSLARTTATTDRRRPNDGWTRAGRGRDSIEFRCALAYAQSVSSRDAAWQSTWVPLFPLPDIVLFPAMRLPLHVFEPRYRRMVADALARDRLIAVPRLKPGFADDYYDSPAIFEVCGVGRITKHRLLADGRYDIVVEGLARARLEEQSTETPYRVAHAQRLEDKLGTDPVTMTAVKNEVWHLLRQLLPYLPEPDEKLEFVSTDSGNVSESADALASVLVSDPDLRQRLLEELDPAERLAQLIPRLHELLRLAGAETIHSGSLN